MRIENFRSEVKASKARVSATVIWEDCDRETQEIFFETDDSFAQDLCCGPHAFLVASILPAMRHGEERVAVGEQICPELRNGLTTAMGWLCRWYGPPRKVVRIEAKAGARPPSPRAARRAGALMSGGIDSLSTLRTNRLDFPPDHPRFIKDCLFVHGFDIGGTVRTDQQLGSFERAMTSLSAVAAESHFTLIPVSTNVRRLDDDDHFSMYEFQGAVLSSVAHAFTNRLTTVSIAASVDFDGMPLGSHPLLDPNYSSTELQILHDGTRFTRLQRVRLVADWDVALQNIRVCTTNLPGMLNCGKCEKCVRTMTELLAVGKLADSQAFPVHDVSSDLLDSIEFEDELMDSYYCELMEPLKAVGRLDLMEVIQAKSSRFHKRMAWEQERDWKGAVKRFDRRYFAGGMFGLWSRLHPLLVKPSGD